MPTLQHVFREHYDAYARSRTLSERESRAGHAIQVCRTAALGGHVQRCPNGHVERVQYNACRNRACPQCNGLARERWLARTTARLVGCAHHHVIFTVPHELNALWLTHRALLMQALFGAVRDTLAALLDDPRYLGATPGIILALHTWGRSLSLHPHIHALITDGGLSAQGRWCTPRRSHFLPARVVMALFRGKFLAALRQLPLTLPDAMPRDRFTALLNRLGRRKWNVHVCARYAHGAGVSAYLSRYVRGGPLSNSQIAHARDARVTFRYTPHDAGGRRESLEFTAHGFIGRVLVHAPEPGRHVVRHYGLYAPTRREALDRARRAHGQEPASLPEPIAWQDYLARFPNAVARTRCPHCGASLVTGMRVAPARAPP